MDEDRGAPPMSTPDTSLQSGGLGLGIGLANAVLYTLLPVLLAVAIWTMVSVYAIVKWIGSAPDQANPVVIVVGTVLLVTLLVVLIAVAVGLVGRSMNPKRRAKD
jgi:Flp pilus assembly pilin Flp